MVLKAEQFKFYKSNGYLRVPDVFSSHEVDGVRALVHKLYRKFEPLEKELDALPEPWNDSGFDKKMINLRARDPKSFGALYDCAQSSVEFLHFVTDRRVVDLAAACLDEDSDSLSYSGIMLRMDPPKDNRNSIHWHQDRAYYPQNEDGNHGIVATIALQDIRRETGALIISPGSHREGYVVPKREEKQNYETTEQRGISLEMIERYDQVPAEMNKGDLMLMNMNLFHRSGENSGDHIRYTALCRFHRILADDYVSFGILYQFNKFLSDQIWKLQRSY